MYPVVLAEPDNTSLLNENVRSLQEVGGIVFDADARRNLQRIADGWIFHDRVRQSPRPKDFRRRLQKMKKAVEDMIVAVNLNKGDAPLVDHHLYNWMINSLFNSNLDGVGDLLHSSTLMIHEGHKVINSLRRVEQNLPADEGRRRPMDESRFIIYLANQFEASGGSPVAYHNVHTGSGFGNTSFRNFVHGFYKMLPIKSKRTEIGLDKEILRALKYRRHH